MRNAPLPKGMVTSFFLSIMRAFECIVNAFFCCLDIYMTNKWGFTLSRSATFFEFFTILLVSN